MFIEHINKNVIFHDDENTYTYDDLIHYVKCAQFELKKHLNKPSIIGFCSQSSFFELTTILAVLELGHKILFVPKKHIFYYDIHDEFFEVLDLIVDLTNSKINNRNIKVIKWNDIYHSGEFGDLIIENDELKTGFVFLSSGTTGKPKVIEQTHMRLIHAAQQTMERIWEDNKNFLLHRGNTINHLGIFTTTYLPAIFSGENVSWCHHVHKDNELIILNSDKTPIYNSILVFPYQPIELIDGLPLSNKVKIVTGGSTISDEFVDRLFENENIDSIYNVYGATEIITPIMWNCIRRDTRNKLFNKILDGLVVNVNFNNQIESIGGLVDGPKCEMIPDILNVMGDDEYEFVGRKSNNLFRNLKNINRDSIKSDVHNITLTEDQFIDILTERLGVFESPKPIIIKESTDLPDYDKYFLIYDPKKHVKIYKMPLEEINNVIYMYYGVTSNQLDYALITNKIDIDNLSDFNNGLKLDRGAIKKIINNKLNNKKTTLI